MKIFFSFKYLVAGVSGIFSNLSGHAGNFKIINEWDPGVDFMACYKCVYPIVDSVN